MEGAEARRSQTRSRWEERKAERMMQVEVEQLARPGSLDSHRRLELLEKEIDMKHCTNSYIYHTI